MDLSNLPGWPRYLSREEAARYVGVSPTTFDAEIGAGWWPPPRRREAKATRLTWDRILLDAYADRESGVAVPIAAMPAALPKDDPSVRGVLNAPPRHRPQHRQPPRSA